jgi:general secretion pathway protein D
MAMLLSCIATVARGATSPTIKASTDASTARIGATVTVTVRINHAHNVGSVPFTLLYDPAILEFVGATSREGGFLKQNHAATTFIARIGPLSRGGGVVVGLSRLDSVRGADGKGSLCHLTFRAIAPGLSPLTFNRATLLDSKAQPLGAGFTGSSIRVRPAS